MYIRCWTSEQTRELPDVKEMFERAAKEMVKGGDGDEDGGEKAKAGQDFNRRGLDAKYLGFGTTRRMGRC